MELRTSLCSMHFEVNCFNYGLARGRKILREGSLPTLHVTKAINEIRIPEFSMESSLPTSHPTGNVEVPIESLSQKRKTSPYPSVPKLLDMDLNNPTSSELDVKPLTYNPHFALNTTSQSGLDHRLLSSQNEDSPDMKNSSPTRFNNEDSSFFQFFRSIHSDYLELSAKNQRLFKRKCFDILCNLLEEEGDANRPISNSSHQDNILKLTNLDDISEENIDIKPLVENGYILPN